MATLMPTKIPTNYFDSTKIQYISDEVTRNLRYTFKDNIKVTDDDIKRVLLRVLEERLEEEHKMTIRTIMYLINEVKAHHIEKMRNLNWEYIFPYVGGIYDNLSKTGPDMNLYKPSKQATTLRYYLTY